MSQPLQLLPPKTNTIRFAPKEGAVLLELAEDRVVLNQPDGKPLIEAHSDGTVIVRGEEVASNADVYFGFTSWLKEATRALFLSEPTPPPTPKPPLMQILKLVRQEEILREATEQVFRDRIEAEMKARQSMERRIARANCLTCNEEGCEVCGGVVSVHV
jgi:hypothetical protein